MLRLPAASLAPYEAFTCYNSPYPAHDDASAIDLYPKSSWAQSPVAGEVTDIHRVRAPWQPYAREFDYVIAIDTAEGPTPLRPQEAASPAVARILHVDPDVDVGDRVAIGDHLGNLVRAGFFAPWVANHLHVDFKPSTTHLPRAGGTVPLSIDVDVTPVSFDGTATVVATGGTFVELAVEAAVADAEWVGLASDGGHVLDGGLPHYHHGGRIDRITRTRQVDAPRCAVELLGTRVGIAHGTTLRWDDLTVCLDGEPVTGLSLFCGRPSSFRLKVVCPGHDVDIGQRCTIALVEEQSSP